ncbi:testis expressed 22 [Phyllostomus discolor]|uniref:Testis expressed 22 n=2 Tax=Phyllostomus discolor TaxID=89673 RepID=A0A834EXK1_9CHIR|nr:testis expressed 22 [Phyllostomus discolor]
MAGRGLPKRKRDAGSRGSPGGSGALPPEPRGADRRAAQAMSSRKPLLADPHREKSGPQLPQGPRLASPSPGPTDTWGQPGPQSSSQQAPETQDWVSEPQESREPRRHWSLSIDERRQRAMRGSTGICTCRPDLLRVLTQLADEVVDKDVLIPHPQRPALSTFPGRALLTLGLPFSRNATSGAQASRCPRS